MADNPKPRPRLAHFGMHVSDVGRMTDFYSRVLGLTVTDRGSVGPQDELVFLSADPKEHHQLVLRSGRPAEIGFNVVQQISFLVDTLDELRTLYRRVVADGRKVERCITHGNAWSVYFLDPEGNRAEVYCHTPWHIPQPHGFAIDLEQSDAEIEAATEAHCRSCEGFMPAAERARRMEQMMDGST